MDKSVAELLKNILETKQNNITVLNQEFSRNNIMKNIKILINIFPLDALLMRMFNSKYTENLDKIKSYAIIDCSEDDTSIILPLNKMNVISENYTNIDINGEFIRGINLKNGMLTINNNTGKQLFSTIVDINLHENETYIKIIINNVMYSLSKDIKEAVNIELCYMKLTEFLQYILLFSDGNLEKTFTSINSKTEYLSTRFIDSKENFELMSLTLENNIAMYMEKYKNDILTLINNIRSGFHINDITANYVKNEITSYTLSKANLNYDSKLNFIQVRSLLNFAAYVFSKLKKNEDIKQIFGSTQYKAYIKFSILNQSEIILNKYNLLKR